jgi:NAD(P)-dependent dehydrogenase (short-subunit alcohol dehydrogenase family)
MELRGKVAVITGGKRIGRVVAQHLAGRGLDLVLAYRGSKDEADQTAAEVTALGRRATVVNADVSRQEDCAALIAQAVAAFGRVDVLVNMASIYRSKRVSEITADYWDADMNINVRSAFLCAQAALPHMRRTGGGRIVNFADWLSKSGRPNYADFTSHYVAKAGVIALTESLALELASDNILVNAVAPGPILPSDDMTAQDIADVARATPVGHWGGAAEIAKLVVLLCESDFMTGETIRIDGGRHLL